ncbi:MAG: LuxR C-terminal-related transcriptional regulator [Deferribacterales bacterium]
MNEHNAVSRRVVSVAGFSLLFAYILSFLFEGRVLYSVMEYYGASEKNLILSAIVAHFAGLFTCGFFVRSLRRAKQTVLAGMTVSLFCTVPFYFKPSALWFVSLVTAGYASACALASWGYFLKVFTPKNQRIKTCADVLIYSNILMILVNMSAVHISHTVGLTLSLACIAAGVFFIWKLPAEVQEKKCSTAGGTKKPMLILFLFVFVITINSGLMYEVLNPAFEHLTTLTSWYWAVPYIAALAVMRNLPGRIKRYVILYVGMATIMASFIFFMLLGRDTVDYLIVNTLMLGACGIFDLFWWSIIGEMLDYTDNPVKMFGMNLSANVLGVLCGGALGMFMTSADLADSEVAVIALTVVCITLAMLPLLNRMLIMKLKGHAYLVEEDYVTETAQIQKLPVFEPLTAREQEVLKLILTGGSNRAIADSLNISESTVKTHARNIFSKYNVSTRAELISLLLTNK